MLEEDKQAIDKAERMLIMLNKVLFVVGEHSQGRCSAEVAMAEITDIIVGRR